MSVKARFRRPALVGRRRFATERLRLKHAHHPQAGSHRGSHDRLRSFRRALSAVRNDCAERRRRAPVRQQRRLRDRRAGDLGQSLRPAHPRWVRRSRRAHCDLVGAIEELVRRRGGGCVGRPRLCAGGRWRSQGLLRQDRLRRGLSRTAERIRRSGFRTPGRTRPPRAAWIPRLISRPTRSRPSASRSRTRSCPGPAGSPDIMCRRDA